MRFTSTSDKELWVYSIDEYRIPVYATPGDVDGAKCWRVVPAVFLRPVPYDVLSGVIAKVAINRFSGYWIVPWDSFKADKATGVTPDFYFRDPSTGSRVTMVDEEVDAAVRFSAVDEKPSDDFIKSVWHRTGIADLSVVRLVWHTICQEMPRWLMATRKPVDMGWAELHVFPYRINWKQIMLSKFPNIWGFFRLPKAECDAKLMLTDFQDEMMSTDMASIVRAGQALRTIRWCVELCPDKTWWDYVDHVEKQVISAGTKTGYLKRYAGLLLRSYPSAVAVFKSWVQQTLTPSASILSRRGSRGKELVEHVQPGEVRPCSSEGLPVRITTNSNAMAIRDSSTGRLVACEAQDLQKVPVVDFNSGHLRSPGGDDNSSIGGDDSAGMLVQHENGCEASTENVLGQS